MMRYNIKQAVSDFKWLVLLVAVGVLASCGPYQKRMPDYSVRQELRDIQFGQQVSTLQGGASGRSAPRDSVPTLSVDGVGASSDAMAAGTELAVESTQQTASEGGEQVAATSEQAAEGTFEQKKSKVALLLPFSGEQSSRAKSMQHAIQLALIDNPETQQTISLIPIDTAGTPEGAQEAINQAIAREVDVILGPLTYGGVADIYDQAEQNGLTIIALTNDLRAAAKGAYAIGYNRRYQLKRILDYAYQAGLRDFSALLENTEENTKLVDELTDNLRRRNLRPKRVEYYDTVGEQLSRSIEQITYLDPSLPPQRANSQGLVIPEGGKTLLTIVGRMNRRGLQNDHMRLLGNHQWNERFLLGEPMMEGGWATVPPPNKVKPFTKHFSEIYGYEPASEVTLGYDAMSMVMDLLSSPGGDPFGFEMITRPKGFSGATGLFRFDKNRVAQHAMAVAEINKGRLNVLDPAPKVFIQSLEQ